MTIADGLIRRRLGQGVGTRQPVFRLSLAHDQMCCRQALAPFRCLRGDALP